MLKATLLENELESATYTSDELRDDARCSHFFRRVSPYKVECTKCHSGYYDSPDSEFPVDELNEYYQMPKTKDFYKKLL
jgi:hypothetical protein